MNQFEMFVRTPLVFAHFLFAAYAIVVMLMLDFRTMRFYRRPVTQAFLDHMNQTHIVVGLFLGLLYLSGFNFVIVGARADGGYLSNENLYFKMTLVLILTINLFLAHLLAKNTKTGDTIDFKPWIFGLGYRLVPVISINTWLWASFSGVAKSWNHVMQYEHMMGMYCITVAVSAGLLIGLTRQWGHVPKVSMRL